MATQHTPKLELERTLPMALRIPARSALTQSYAAAQTTNDYRISNTL